MSKAGGLLVYSNSLFWIKCWVICHRGNSHCWGSCSKRNMLHFCLSIALRKDHLVRKKLWVLFLLFHLCQEILFRFYSFILHSHRKCHVLHSGTQVLCDHCSSFQVVAIISLNCFSDLWQTHFLNFFCVCPSWKQIHCSYNGFPWEISHEHKLSHSVYLSI